MTVPDPPPEAFTVNGPSPVHRTDAEWVRVWTGFVVVGCSLGSTFDDDVGDGVTVTFVTVETVTVGCGWAAMAAFTWLMPHSIPKPISRNEARAATVQRSEGRWAYQAAVDQRVRVNGER